MGEPTQQAPKKTRGRWILEGALVIALVIGIRAWQSYGTASGEAPAIAGVDLAGAAVSLDRLERPVVVHFMASWCGVCAAEEGNVAALARDHDVIAIASQSGDEGAVRAWISTTDLGDVRIIPDPRGDLARAWGVRAFPTAFYLDRAGRIRHVEVGYTSELGMRLRVWLSGLSG